MAATWPEPETDGAAPALYRQRDLSRVHIWLEASAGDPFAAAARLKLLEGLPTVPINEDVRNLARAIVLASMMPKKAAADALHVAAAAVAGVQYLLTLNCKHIANAHELPRVYRLLRDNGFGQLLICTPAEFLGGQDDDDKEPNS